MDNKSKNNSLMQLDKLIKMRENLEKIVLPISEEELCDRYEKLYTGAVNDVLREKCLLNQALPAQIHPLHDEMKVCGIAYTIKSTPELRISGEMDKRANMLDDMPQNCICVWETGGDTDVAHWGEVMTAVSKNRGARGAVIDGGLRDTHQVLEQNFPVFYKYRISNGTLARCRIIDYNIPVKIGNVIIYPGDIIFGDIDGVVVVPRKIAYDVLIRTEEIKKNEKEIRDWVENGLSAKDVVKKGGYF
jgi:4-hydroxy-4-methyl-2-oxoglutarate aldolase